MQSIKLVYDLLLYWSIAILFHFGAWDSFRILYSLFFCALAFTLSCQLQEKGFLRMLPMVLLIPVYPLSGHGTFFETLYLTIPNLYVLGCALFLRYPLPTVQAEDTLGFRILPGLIVQFFHALTGVSVATLWLPMAEGITGIFMLRMMRLDRVHSLKRRNIISNAASLVILLTAGLILSLPSLWKTLLHLLNLVRIFLLSPLLSLVLYIFLYILMAAAYLISLFLPELSYQLPELQSELFGYAESTLPSNIEPSGSSIPIQVLFRGGLTVLILFFGYVFFRKLSEPGAQVAAFRSELIEEKMTAREITAAREKKPSSGIRAQYQRLLKGLTQHEKIHGKAFTTEDVYEATIPCVGEEKARTLRDLYRKNRYGTSDTPSTAEEIQEARHIVKEILSILHQQKH